MKRLAYDASLPVIAAWALEFAPVNVSAVFLQPHGNEYLCVGSSSWMFEGLADCITDARSSFPWRASEHVLPPEPDPPVWADTFHSLRVYNTVHAPELTAPRRMVLAQRLLARVSIDTAPRPWAPDGNNALLIDSLNGYRVKELSSHSDVFTLNILATHEQYLSRALENFAAWEWRGGAGAEWGPAVDYSKQDKAVI